MKGRRPGRRANTASCVWGAVALALAMGSTVSAQSSDEAGRPEPSAPAPSMPSANPPAPPSLAPRTPEETRPAEFPGVVQSGGISVARSPFARPWPTQRNVALLATQGSYNGFGLGVRGGWLRVGLDTSFAFYPILATYSVNPEEFPEFKLLTSLQGNASIWFGLHRLDARTDLGIAFGYKYNSLLRHGFSVAFYMQRELGAHWAIQGFVGPNIFPEAEEQIRQRTGWAQGSVSSGMAWHQAGLGVSLAFFP